MPHVSAFPPVRTWRIHLGAHKTATTHLQDTLRAHRAAMLPHGVDYIPREDFGPLGRRYSRPRGWRKMLRSRPLEWQFTRELQRLRRGPDTVLISDEDLLGYSFDQLTTPLYQRPKCLHLVRALGRTGRMHLFLGIRSLDGLVPSAYAQTLKAVVPEPDMMARARRALADDPPSWVDLVDRLRAALPGVPLTVWRYEDYRAHWRAILALYVGRDVGEFPDLPPPPLTVSPSPLAIEKAEALDPSLPMKTRIDTVRALYARYPAGPEHGVYAPLDPDEIDRFRARYAADIDILRTRYPGLLATF
jgi:hypothetical protein